MTKIKIRNFFIYFLGAALGCSILGIAGCASTSSDFECPNPGSVMCKRLDQVDQMADRGEITANQDGTGETADTDGQSDHVVTLSNDPNAAFGNFSSPYPISFQPGTPLRYGETVMRIWIAPYEDKEGNYHQQSYVDTVIKPGHWIGNPVKSKGFLARWFK